MTRWSELDPKPAAPAEPLIGRLAGSSDTILPRAKSPADECVEAAWPRPTVAVIPTDSTVRLHEYGLHPNRDLYDRLTEQVLASLTSGEELVSFCARVVRGVVARADRPLTAFEVAREVLKHHPNRWAASTIRGYVSRLAKRGVLRELDCDGVSLDHAPCFRYVLGAAS